MRRILLSTALIIASIEICSAQQDAVSSEQKREIETIATKYFEAINRGDAQKAASFFKSNGIVVTVFGAMVRGQALPEYFERVHKMGANVSLKVENVEPVADGKAVLLTGNFTVTFTSSPEARGTLVQLYEPEGGNWKLRVSIGSREASVPSAPATSEKMKQ